MKVVKTVFVKNQESYAGKWFHPGDDMPEEWYVWVSNESVFDSGELVELSEIPYEKWTVDEIRTELLNRGLPTEGRKRQLIAALLDDDAAKVIG
jgi:SAP domain